MASRVKNTNLYKRYTVVTALAGVFIISTILLLSINRDIYWIDLITNSILSFFCGLVMSSISFFFIYRHTKTRNLHDLFLFTAFMGSGNLDIYSSFVTDINTFFWLRLVNILHLSIFLFFSSLTVYDYISRNILSKAPKFFIFVLVLLIILEIAGILYTHQWYEFPKLFQVVKFQGMSYESFSPIAKRVILLSIIINLVSAILFKSSSQKFEDKYISYIFIYSILTGISNLLLLFTTLWSIMWWAWNAIRLTLHVTMFSIFIASYIYIFNQLLETNKKLKKAYIELQTAQEKLIQNEKKLAIVSTAAAIIHEIRTPLATILNYLQLLEDIEDKQINQIKHLIKDEILRIKRITEIFNYSGNKYKPNIRKVKVDRVINEWVDEFTSLYEEETRNVQIHIHAPSIEWNMDPDAFKIVLTNLLKNAVESIEEKGSVYINVWLKDRKLFISVRDTGKGIPPEKIKYIFDPFYTSKASGLGLGLFVVNSIVKAHMGHIEVKSIVNEGTEIVITIPLIDQDSP